MEAPIFSSKWATDDVPGINKILGDRFNSQANATCFGVAPRSFAIADNVSDWKGVKPPSGDAVNYYRDGKTKKLIKNYKDDSWSCYSQIKGKLDACYRIR